jgi:4'-phosphopantetheinyl transferase
MNLVQLKVATELGCSSLPHYLEQLESPEDDVRIWIARLDSILPNDIAELQMMLDSSERTRAAQFRFERDRQRYVAARSILRYLIGIALGISASSVVFAYGPHGKPESAVRKNDERTLRFNLSHAAGLAIFALSWDRELGIDLEARERLSGEGRNLAGLAARVLSPRELAVWRALPNELARRDALLRAWTRKEAYLKATGQGLSDELQSIEVALDAAKPQPSLTRNGWMVHDLIVPGGFAAALAVERG